MRCTIIRMLRATWVLVVVACGRVSFTPTPAGDGGGPIDTAAADTPVGMACSTDLECGRCARCDGTCQTEPITEMFLGHRSTCYVGAGGTRWCAGDNTDGQLGLGDTTARSVPTRPGDGDDWERIFLFFYGAALGVRQGQFWTWGGGALVPNATGPARDVRAMLGDLNPTCFWEADGTAPTCSGAGATVWRSLDYSASHFCGVRAADRTLWCWGTSYSNALGATRADGTLTATATQVGSDTDWEDVGAGGRDAGVNFTGSTCARKMSGEIYCFGHPSLTGTNGVDVGAVPTQLVGGPWTFIDMDWQHACAGKADGSVWCWGADTYGGFVAPGLIASAVPVQIPGTYTRWKMGGHHACGLTPTARWRCFGWNDDGQLGIGTTGGNGEVVDLCP
jgi:alpha-tubulin suppressor-like RCC1 family protein